MKAKINRFRIDYYNFSQISCGYLYDKTRYIYNISLKDLYKYLVTYSKDNYNANLLAIYVSKEVLSENGYCVNVKPIFSIHIGKNILVEDSKTFLCAMVK